MTARCDVPLWWLVWLRIKLALAVLRFRARRLLIRLIRRIVDWLEPAG